MNRTHKTAPLPFQGQKRNFAQAFPQALAELNPDGRITTIVDLFGGSGLLSHLAKRAMPQCEVIFNDFDDFHQRLETIPRTNALLAQLREILADYPRHERITGDHRRRIEEALLRAGDDVDCVTLSASLLFSCKYEVDLDGLLSQGFYNNVRAEDYPEAPDYLAGIEVVKVDYKELFARFAGRDDVLFLVDPPYLSTDASSYKSGTYWRLKDYLDVLLVLLNGNYVYFTSSKSQIVELCDWFADHFGLNTPFSNAVVRTHQVRGKVLNYTDMMLYKGHE